MWLRLKGHLTRTSIEAYLKVIKQELDASLRRQGLTSRIRQVGVMETAHLSRMPTSLKGLESFIFQDRISRLTQEVVACSSCYTLYRPRGTAPEDVWDLDEVSTNSKCVFKKGGTAPANCKGTVNVKMQMIKFGEWKGQFLARPEIEKALQEMQVKHHNATTTKITDITESPSFRRVLDADGNPIYLKSGHLVWELWWDHGDLRGNLGRQYSLGLLWLVCLSLPAHMRERTENSALLCIA
jgi:hypothetical protein